MRLGDYRKSSPEFRNVLDFYLNLLEISVDIVNYRDCSRDHEVLIGRTAVRVLDKFLEIMKSDAKLVASVLDGISTHPSGDSLKELLNDVASFGIGGPRIATASAP